jgi:Tn3 transposase DDE domain
MLPIQRSTPAEDSVGGVGGASTTTSRRSNSTYIADAVAHLRATEQSVPDAWLAHTSPLSWEHISFSGDFLWERAAATADKRRPLNLGQTRVAA